MTAAYDKCTPPTTVFLSGGTALKSVSVLLGLCSPSSVEPEISVLDAERLRLRDVYHKSTHLITSFDSGGSSYTLRKAFHGLPAVGDLRNRLCSLAQGHLKYIPPDSVCCFQLTRLFKFRFPSPSAFTEYSAITEATMRRCMNVILHRMVAIVAQDLRDIDHVKEQNAVSLAWHLHSTLNTQTDSTSSCSCVDKTDRLPELQFEPCTLVLAQETPTQLDTSREICDDKCECSCQIQVDIIKKALHSMSHIPAASMYICAVYLHRFLCIVPSSFTYSNASIGNLVIAGAFSMHSGDLVAAIDSIRVCLGVEARVIPTSVDNLTLGAILDNDRTVVGQHAMTSKKGNHVLPDSGIEGAVRDFFLVDVGIVTESDEHRPVVFPTQDIVRCVATATAESTAALRHADIICYSIGSFYTSLIASILPRGIGEAIFNNKTSCRIFVPNMLYDPEMIGLSLHRAVEILCDTLGRDIDMRDRGVEEWTGKLQPREFVSFVLVDQSSTYSQYGSTKAESLAIIKEDMDIPVVEEDICSINVASGKFELDAEKFLLVLKRIALYRN